MSSPPFLTLTVNRRVSRRICLRPANRTPPILHQFRSFSSLSFSPLQPKSNPPITLVTVAPRTVSHQLRSTRYTALAILTHTNTHYKRIPPLCSETSREPNPYKFTSCRGPGSAHNRNPFPPPPTSRRRATTVHLYPIEHIYGFIIRFRSLALYFLSITDPLGCPIDRPTL